MPEIDNLVSVIIPAYNAEKFIKETIDSVKKQTYTSWEIIVVNDGSKDSTVEIVTKELSGRIQLINQENAGVSAARNKGILSARGEYLVFFDADDLMTPDFLLERVKVLDKNPHLGFVGGIIETFPVKHLRKAAAEDPENEIFFFENNLGTGPSNYMIRKKTLLDNNIKYNPALSSTADRFFILQMAAVSKGKLLETDNGRMLYRINEQSMSHKVSPALIRDNEKFYYEVLKAGLLPVKRKLEFKAIYFFSLAMGFRQIRYWGSFIKYCLKSFLASPFQFVKLVFKKR
jgi:glycosyltransferase involved in cell wall biosynthesis